MPYVALNNNKDLSKKRKLEQKYILKKVITYIKESNVELLFISGDLFEQSTVQIDTINYIISLFREIPNVKIYITPGNHDPLIKNSPYNTFEFPDNVFIFSNELGIDKYKELTIYGLGFNNYEMNSLELSTVNLNKEEINVLITHGTLNGNSKKYHDIPEKWISNFDYVALGHIHQKKIDSTKIIYPGSLIATGFDEPGTHGMVVGEIYYEDENKKRIPFAALNNPNIEKKSKVVKYKFVKMDDTEFETIDIDISEYYSINEIIDALNLENNIYKIILNGIKNVSIDTLIETIKISNSNVCQIIDNTIEDFDLEKISKQNNLKGVFTKKILKYLEKNPDKKDIVKKAINYIYN